MASPIIWAPGAANNLTPNLEFANGAGPSILTGSVNPSAVATAANEGSLYLNSASGITYQKQDAGSTTNWIALSTSSGTVTSVSVVSANGLAGTVATATTTPALTLSTTVTGILQGNGTAISAASTTGSGSVVLATAPTMTNPVVGTQTQGDSSTKAASTSYVDVAVANAVAGINPAVAVQAATTSASDTSSFTYNNGASGIGATFTGAANTALTVDGYTFTALGQRLLVKNDTQSPSGAFNGIYYVTQVQTAILPLILTRALDYDQPSDINNTGAIPVINGTVNSTTSWVETALIVTVGTTPLVFVEFTRNPADYLLKANNLSDVANKATSYNNLSPMTTTGDIEYEVSTGVAGRLGIGSTGQVLSPVAGVPAWTNPYGATITAWAPYSMVITGSISNPTLGTTSINQAVWRQVGDSIEIIYTLLQTGAGTAGSGVYLFSLPNSYVIDTTKQVVNVLIEQSVVGPAKVNVSASSARPAYVYAYDTTHLALSDLTIATDGSFNSIGSSLYSFTNTTVCYTFTARIPIVGLNVYSIPSPTPVMASYGMTTSTAVGAAGIVKFDTLRYDPSSSYSSTTGKFTVPITGVYNATFTAIATVLSNVIIVKNAVNVAYVTSVNSGVVQSGTVSISCTAGDLLDFAVDTGTTINGITSGAFASTMTISLIK